MQPLACLMASLAQTTHRASSLRLKPHSFKRSQPAPAHNPANYQFDPQGNAVHLLNDHGTADAHLAYDAWGQLVSGNNPTPYGYKAQWGYTTDAESGILFLTHRYFDPATGRFLTRDPIGIEGGVNLYAYVGNGVVVRTDHR